MQEQIWWLHQSLPATDLLNMFYALSVEGPLDIEALSRTLEEIGRRHEPLRTTYPAVDGKPVAKVRAEAEIEWKQETLGQATSTHELAEVARRAAEEAHRPFHLARGPLLRVLLLTLGPDRHVLMLNFHHIVADGWSLEIFCRECSILYRSFLEQRSGALEELRDGCVDHADWQAEWLGSEQARQELEWWRSYLPDAPKAAFSLPTDRPRGESSQLEISRQLLALPPDLVEELQSVGRQRGASLYMVLLAALEILLARWTQSEEVVLGTLAANRETALSSGIVGAHYNPILIYTNLADEPCLGEVLMRVVESTLPALEHQGWPFADLCHRLAGSEPSGAPLPAAMLLQDRYPLASFALAGATITPLHLDEGGAESPGELLGPRRLRAATNADLTFFVREHAERQTLSVFYKTDLFYDSTIQQLLEAYSEVLFGMVESLESSMMDLDLPLPVGTGLPEPVDSDPAQSPGLFPITELSPVDALSPVVCLQPNDLARSQGDLSP